MSMKYIRRKLQFAGNSSYVLTLPKTWIIAANLDYKNAEVLIEELSDQTIRILPANHKDETSDKEEKDIYIKKDSSHEEIIRLILASYLASKAIITIRPLKGKSIPAEYAVAINDICQKLWGSEVIEESATQIVIHDALNPGQMQLVDIIKKAWFTAKNMMEQAFNAIFTKDQNQAQFVINSERTLDKLYYLALRQLYKASSNMMFASEIGIIPGEIIDYHLLIKNIERIGDHAEQLVANINVKFKNKENLMEAAAKTQNACAEAISSFLEGNGDTAQLAINRKDEIHKFMSNITQDDPNEFAISKSILRISDYASDIGELVLNRVIASN